MGCEEIDKGQALDGAVWLPTRTIGARGTAQEQRDGPSGGALVRLLLYPHAYRCQKKINPSLFPSDAGSSSLVVVNLPLRSMSLSCESSEFAAMRDMASHRLRKSAGT